MGISTAAGLALGVLRTRLLGEFACCALPRIRRALYAFPMPRLLIVTLVAGLFASLIESCLPTKADVCGPSTCPGCCDPAGACRPGTAADACGARGGACAVCGAAQACLQDVCFGLAPYLDAGPGDAGLDGGAGDGGAADGGVVDSGPPALRVFVTRAVYTGNLAREGDAGSGLEGGDRLCGAAAESALLGGTWRALLSEDGGSPAARITGSGPWAQQRADGVQWPTFANQGQIDGVPATRISTNEIGLDATGYAWTGAGTPADPGVTCNGFTTTAGDGTGGAAGVATPFWLSTNVFGCSQLQHLFCFETSRSPAAALGPPKRVFVTQQKFTGDLNVQAGTADGLSGGDLLCNQAAAAAGLGGTFHAWLSSPAADALDRLPGNGPWYQPQPDAGLLLTFPSRAGLVNGPATGLLYDETGQRLTYSGPWTGTTGKGRVDYDTCLGFTVGSGNAGRIAQLGAVDDQWTFGINLSCTFPTRLICFED
jgi:hypothetical protein